MGDFKQGRGNRFSGGHGGGFGRRDGGRPNFPRKSWGGSGGRDRGPVAMHQAICAQCRKPCEVPFRPTDGKPVYCNVCFGARKEAENNRGGDRFPQKNFNSYKTPIRTDLENNISKGNNDGLKKQFDILNTKLDRLIKALTPAVPVKEEKKEVIVGKKEVMAKGNNSRRKETKKPKKGKKK